MTISDINKSHLKQQGWVRSALNDNNKYSYTYDENGIRTSKTYCGETTYYSTNNGIITSQYKINAQGEKCDEMIFLYNSLNELVGVNCKGYNFYYLKNAMGNVVGFVDEYGNYVEKNYLSTWGDFGYGGNSVMQSGNCANRGQPYFCQTTTQWATGAIILTGI